MAIDFQRNKIFVEGDADKIFIRDIFKLWYKIELSSIQLNEFVIICDGYSQIEKQKDQFKQTEQGQKREGGKNLVIFDADYVGGEAEHGIENKRKYLESIKNDLSIEFEVFLFPDNQKDGTLETILESCINPKHKGIIDCWYALEECIKSKGGYTIPADKSKIYVYLECLHGKSRAEKNKIKDQKRDFTLNEDWLIDCNNNPFLERLKSFFDEHLNN
jgi:hypothetical protein